MLHVHVSHRYWSTLPWAHIIERARILRDDVQLASKRSERLPVDRVRVSGAYDIRARRMNSRVDGKRCPVESGKTRTRLRLNIAMVVDEKKVFGLNQRERLCL